ncbi:MAG: META domain-containing protein [Marinifilaceae bacterium]
MKNLFFVMICCMVVACTPKSNVTSLYGVKWELISIEGEKLNKTEGDDNLFLRFDEKETRVNGKGTCNRFFGNYDLDGTKLKFSPLGATRMACPDQQLEMKFFKLMEKVDNYTIAKNELQLKSGSTILLTFKMVEDKETSTAQE